MFKTLLILALTITLSSATMSKANGSCTLAQTGNIEVNWKAYKTPAKLGVGGKFDKTSYTAIKKSGTNFTQIFVGSSINIDTASVNSNHPARDAKLLSFFFEKMSGKNITAKIVGYSAGKREKGKPKTGIFQVEITMNGVTKTTPMNFSYFDGLLEGSGIIDIFDFQAHSALSSINKACFDLHKGKTWSDVNIGFKTRIVAVCNPK